MLDTPKDQVIARQIGSDVVLHQPYLGLDWWIIGLSEHISKGFFFFFYLLIMMLGLTQHRGKQRLFLVDENAKYSTREIPIQVLTYNIPNSNICWCLLQSTIFCNTIFILLGVFIYERTITKVSYHREHSEYFSPISHVFNSHKIACQVLTTKPAVSLPSQWTSPAVSPVCIEGNTTYLRDW